ncbi:Amidohydrolase 2 [Penicillium waksmanii]|uniref:Amidohydrolase 2 n=1 Tax=Penicillium waksmanii TaxID=69791 RepID=UPI0025474A19|nr:Amidohydrolase 2 [Penicillium waksmanii]KAJ5983214.1 Amidohydrolase 2 [Penicillium waksmanii]
MVSLSWGFLLACSIACHATAHSIDSNYRIDVHSHAIPEIWKQAMISAGFPIENGTLYNDGAPVPDWSLDTHITSMDTLGLGKLTYSFTTTRKPIQLDWEHSVFFLFLMSARRSKSLRYNVFLPIWLGAHPDFCLYLGNFDLEPIFKALDKRSAGVFVHPASPACTSVGLGHPMPMIEYPFDTVRAIENLLLTGQRARYPDLNIIFSHGGGAIPYLATRIAGVATLPYEGGIEFPETLAQLAGYYFDLASATSAIQLAALKSFIGAKKLVTGIDCTAGASRYTKQWQLYR